MYPMAGEKKSFGEFLVGLGVLTADQLKKASQEQKQRGERLEQTIVVKHAGARLEGDARYGVVISRAVHQRTDDCGRAG